MRPVLVVVAAVVARTGPSVVPVVRADSPVAVVVAVRRH
jgi:hypothetical protein